MYKVLKITADEVVFTNGHTLTHEHEQDCCEYNYADFTSLSDTVFETDSYNTITIEPAEYGVLINGHMVNCYSSQSGYYSTQVSIMLVDENLRVLDSISTYGDWS